MDHFSISLFGKSHTGRNRQENQDRILIKEHSKDSTFLAIADGMGGVAAGGLAADTAVRYLDNHIDMSWKDPAQLARLTILVGDQIMDIATSKKKYFGMGTTLTTILIGDGLATWAHVGDSRLYSLRCGKLAQVTRDHRFLQDLIDTGVLTSKEALKHPLRNYLDQCVGTPGLKPDCGLFPLEMGDTLLLTTDGLHDYVEPERIVTILDSARGIPEALDMLIMEALDSGSMDDMSIALARVEEA